MTNDSTKDGKDHNSFASHSLIGEMAVLSAILVVLLFLADKPFGFRTFLNGLGQSNIFSLSLLLSIIATFLIMLQRLGIMFSNDTIEQTQTN